MNVQHLSKSVMRVFQTIESRTAWIHYMQTCIKKCEKGIRMIVCNVAKSKIIRFFSDARHSIFLKKNSFPSSFALQPLTAKGQVENLFGEIKTAVPSGVLKK